MIGKLIWLGISTSTSPVRCLPTGKRVFGGGTGGTYVDVVVELQCDFKCSGLVLDFPGERKGASTPRRGFTSFAHCGRKLSTLLLNGKETEKVLKGDWMVLGGFSVDCGLDDAEFRDASSLNAGFSKS